MITGPALALDRATGNAIMDARRLGKLHGLAYTKDTCGEYLSATLKDIGVAGGLHFSRRCTKRSVSGP